MKEGRFSTIRFNEWICISAQYEKAIARIGKQVYQGYSKGLVTDFTSIELCKEIGDTFAEARQMRAELEEELERDALDGLNVEEAAKADEVRELSSTQKTKRAVKLKFTKFMGRQAINRSLATHRNRVKELSRELGQRALICFPDEPVLKVRGHKSLCRLATKLDEDANLKWTEITENKGKGGGGLSFHTILFGMVADFARFSKGTQVGKMLLKYFKYDEKEENQKLTQQYAGTITADALKAQMAEVDEPMLDVGREIDNMQQEYQENPEEWSMTGGEGWGEATEDEGWDSTTTTDENWGASGGASAKPKKSIDFSPDSGSEDWGTGADEWVPDEIVDDDFLNAVADAPELPVPETFPPPPPPAPARATLVRKRPEPEAESWQEPSQPLAPATPQISSSLGASPMADRASGIEDPDDWGWGSENSSAGEPSSTSPSLQSAPASEVGPDPSQDALAAESAKKSTAPPPPSMSQTEFKSKPAGKKPPFVKTQKEKPLGHWSPEEEYDKAQRAVPPRSQPAESWETPSATPASSWDSPAPKTGGSTWDTPAPPKMESSQDDDYGWGAPAAAKGSEPQPEPAPAPEPDPLMEPFDPTLDTMSIDVAKLAEQIRTTQGEDDPLLRLLDVEPAVSTPASQSIDSGELGDDLLPDFLKDRADEDTSEDSAFIPELPSFLESEDAPNLEILPFGTSPKKSGPEGDEDIGTFIPDMPE